MARAAAELAELPPWEALSQWLHQYVASRDQACLTEALLDVDPESDALSACRIALVEAGNALVERAQAAGAVRPDTELPGHRAHGERDRRRAHRRSRATGADALARARRAPLPPRGLLATRTG